MTVLEIINEAQRLTRLPQSPTIADPHAKICLSFINEVMRDYMAERAEWDALKVYTTLSILAGTAVYAVSVASTELDKLKNIQIGVSKPLVPLDDEEFLSYKRNNSLTNQPLAYRIRSRNAAGTITIEVCPTPDQNYTADIEATRKPVKVSTAGEVPELDSDTILLGLIMRVQKDKGIDYSLELAAFEGKLESRGNAEGNSNWGDAEGV